MIDRDLVTALDDCIHRLARGQRVEDCLGIYPDYADELAPMLEAGQLVQRAQSPQSEVESAQARVFQHFDQALLEPIIIRPTRRRFPLQSVAGWVATFLIVLSLMTGGTVALAQNSLPGDVLYPVKLLSEDIRLSLSGQDALLKEKFIQERLKEISRLLEIGRAVEVMFIGTVEGIIDNQALVDGFVVDLNEAIVDPIDLQIGNRVSVRGRTTENGQLIADSILPVIDERPVVPTDIVSPTPTTTETLRPTLTATSTPSPTSTPTPSNTPTTTNTPSPTKTVTPSRTPTVRPSSTPSDRPPITATRDDNASQAGRGENNSSVPDCVVSPLRDWFAYTAQGGEDLTSIVSRVNGDLNLVLRVNCLTEAGILRTGQVVYLPPIPTTVPPNPPRPTTDPTQRPPTATQAGRNGEGRRG